MPEQYNTCLKQTPSDSRTTYYW